MRRDGTIEIRGFTNGTVQQELNALVATPTILDEIREQQEKDPRLQRRREQIAQGKAEGFKVALMEPYGFEDGGVFHRTPMISRGG